MKDVNGKEIDAYALTLQFHHSNLKNSIELNSFNFGGDKNLVEFTKLLRERLNKRGKK
ncbi:MAG: hypothetical protein JXA79_12855 [Deltaproteobacteria bacterium]|nr:hypothetical protein [Deltaproteobacteria bacterium]